MKNHICYKHTRVFYGREFVCGSDLSWIEKGMRVFLCELCYEDGGHTFFLRPYEGEGYPGNCNPILKAYHGWRGTTNGKSVYVYGVREVLEVGELKTDEEGRQTLEVTLSKDLFPKED